MKLFIPFASAFLFALGLGLGGMAQPEKVQGFLNVFGDWDPALVFVMAGAVAVYAGFFQIVKKLSHPVFDYKFYLPTRKDIDTRLVGGAALFGIGWGLSGICPGPALISLFSGGTSLFVFIGAMLVGMRVMEKV